MFGGEELGEAGVVGEVAGDEGDVDVAGLADRFAVVEGFQDGEEAGVFLRQAGEGVEVLGAFVGGEGGPFGLRASCGCDGFGDVFGGAVGDFSEGFAGGRVVGGEGVARRGEDADLGQGA